MNGAGPKSTSIWRYLRCRWDIQIWWIRLRNRRWKHCGWMPSDRHGCYAAASRSPSAESTSDPIATTQKAPNPPQRTRHCCPTCPEHTPRSVECPDRRWASWWWGRNCRPKFWYFCFWKNRNWCWLCIWRRGGGLPWWVVLRGGRGSRNSRGAWWVFGLCCGWRGGSERRLASLCSARTLPRWSLYY